MWHIKSNLWQQSTLRVVNSRRLWVYSLGFEQKWFLLRNWVFTGGLFVISLVFIRYGHSAVDVCTVCMYRLILYIYVFLMSANTRIVFCSYESESTHCYEIWYFFSRNGTYSLSVITIDSYELIKPTGENRV